MFLLQVQPRSINGVTKSMKKHATYHRRKWLWDEMSYASSHGFSSRLRTQRSGHRTRASLETIVEFDSSKTRHGNYLLDNVWDDHFIQSLRSPYLEPKYSKQVELLVSNIKDMMKKASLEYSKENDLMQRLLIVDSLVCLGISRHFEAEIAEALDHVYKEWNKRNGGIPLGSAGTDLDIHSTALAFHLLRFHRYVNISSDVFSKFKNVDISFVKLDERNVEQVKKVINLVRASRIQFPGDNILEEYEQLSTQYLKDFISSETSSSKYPNHLKTEVNYVLEHPWYLNCPRWETRNYIDIYGFHDEWLKCDINQKILQLAKLDYNILQALHQQELKELSRWWKESEISRLNIFRHRPVESYLLGALGVFEKDHAAARIAIGKAFQTVFVLDDIYDTFATINQLVVLTDAINKWDTTKVKSLPEPIPKCLKFLIQTYDEFTKDCSEKQGRDMGLYVRHRWIRLAQCFYQEAEWMANREVPSIDEYLKNGSESLTSWALLVVGKLLICDSFPLDLLEKELEDVSPFYMECGKAARIDNDIHDYVSPAKDEWTLSLAECYMKENPGKTREDAHEAMKRMIIECNRKVNKFYLDPESQDEQVSGVPILCARLMFEVTRAFHFVYKETDGFSVANTVLKNQIRKIFFESFPQKEM